MMNIQVLGTHEIQINRPEFEEHLAGLVVVFPHAVTIAASIAERLFFRQSIRKGRIARAPSSG
jgi:hypothetical protein